MKFHKQLKDIEEKFQDPLLSESCIHYKKWKKIAKNPERPWSFSELEDECSHVDYVIQKRLPRAITLPSRSSMPSLCCGTSHNSQEATTLPDLLLFATINAQAVYKICKKLQKGANKNSMSFLANLRSSHKYMFLGSHIVTRMKLEAQSQPHTEPVDTNTDLEKTCPICFEDIDHQRPAFIMKCGHYNCIQCLEQQTKINKIRGTLRNRIAVIAHKHSCPICSCKSALADADAYSFWPNMPS